MPTGLNKDLIIQGKNKITSLGSFHDWVAQKLIATWEEAVCDILNVPEDTKLNYYYERCLAINEECVHNHKTVWCRGKTVTQFIKKVVKDETACTLHVTAALNKSAIYDDINVLESDNILDESKVNSYWIGDCKMGSDRWMICCDDLWLWLWNHILRRPNE